MWNAEGILTDLTFTVIGSWYYQYTLSLFSADDTLMQIYWTLDNHRINDSCLNGIEWQD